MTWWPLEQGRVGWTGLSPVFRSWLLLAIGKGLDYCKPWFYPQQNGGNPSESCWEGGARWCAESKSGLLRGAAISQAFAFSADLGSRRPRGLDKGEASGTQPGAEGQQERLHVLLQGWFAAEDKAAGLTFPLTRGGTSGLRRGL